MPKLKHIYLSDSSRQDYKTCGRRFVWNRFEGLEPDYLEDLSLSAAWKGTVIHECIDAAYQGKTWKDRFDELLSEVQAIHTIDSTKSGSVDHLREIIVQYMATYSVPNDPDFDVIGTEQTFELPLTEWLTFVGKIDKIVVRKNGSKALVDHKTSSSIARWVEPKVALSDQFTGYIAAAQANGIDTSGLVVDAISTAMTSLKGKSPLFQRFTASRTDEQVEEWRVRFIKDAERMRDDIETGEFTTGQDKACNEFGGKCMFYDVCAATPKARPQMLRNSFSKLDIPWAIDKVVLEDE